MNILYIDHYAGSPQMGMEFRPYYLAAEWVKVGQCVTIIAGDYSHLRKQNPVVEKDFQEEYYNGIRYIWVKTGTYEGNGLNRALTMGRFVRKLYLNAKKIARELKPDVVIASSTYPLDAYAAARIAKLSGAKYIHEVHDMWPSTLYEVGGMSKYNPFVIVMQIAENYAYRQCNWCVSLLPYSRDYMVAHGLAKDKFINIQNGVVEEEWTDYQKIPEEHHVFFEKHSDDFVVGYFGGHALSNALDKILDVAKEIQKQALKERIIFVFVGDGVEKPRLIKRVENEGIDNCFFLPSVPKASIPDLLTFFDCSYMTGDSSPLYQFGLCLNKMYDSMMAELPIICAFDAPDTLVRKYGCGFQCNPADQISVIQAILQIFGMTSEERRLMGARGKAAIMQYYTYRKLAERFLSVFM